jgi:hypothetical protein
MRVQILSLPLKDRNGMDINCNPSKAYLAVMSYQMIEKAMAKDALAKGTARYELQDMARDLPGMAKRTKHPPTTLSCKDLHFSAGFSERLYDLIIHLNDDHHWSREQIADWVETLDNIPPFGE